MRAAIDKLGPGLLFAASAVGVSHLVQSTRAGADFGLSMGVLILLVCLIKYPAFRFAAEYTAIARESVLDAYARQGRWLLSAFLVAIVIEGIAVIPAVSLVAAGMTIELIGLDLNETIGTLAVVGLASLALAIGRYRLLERITRVLVAVFALLSVVATVSILGLLGAADSLAAPLTPTRDNLFFAAAVSGWMPVGMGGAVLLSLWVLAKSAQCGQAADVRDTLFDFNLSYAVTCILALCFLLMGTALLFGRGIELSASSVAFAAQLVSLFTVTVGAWTEPVIGIAALAVILSTVIAVVDGFPRLYADVSRRLLGASRNAALESRLYLTFIVAQALAAALLLWRFASSFGAFIDFATTAGFVVAPVVAFLNHRIMRSPAVPAAARPAVWLDAWSVLGMTMLGIASLTYLYFRFT